MVKFNGGDQVEILMAGEWVGPFEIVMGQPGRTPDHLILSGPSGLFEHYNDAPYNTRKVN